MIRKLMTTVVLGASAFGMMTANAAAAPGPYITGQLGYADTHMGPKTNLKAMYDQLSWPYAFTSDSGAKNLANNGLAGRLAIGYQFNQNFALEMGYLNLRTKQLNGFTNNDPKKPGTAIPAKLKLSQNAFDVAAKAILPVTANFNVYSKLGVAYLSTEIKTTVYTTSPAGTYATPAWSFDDNGVAGIAKHTWAPEVAVGMSYDITPNVSVDTSWTHIQPLGKKRPGNVDFVAVGLGYNFG